MIGPVAARRSGAVAGGVDQEVALVADVVECDGHVLGEGALDACVEEEELRSASGDVRVGIGDAGWRGDEFARAVDVVTGVAKLGRGVEVGGAG